MNKLNNCQIHIFLVPHGVLTKIEKKMLQNDTSKMVLCKATDQVSIKKINSILSLHMKLN